MIYWLVVTSFQNFKHDRENLGFKMQVGDRVAYYMRTCGGKYDKEGHAKEEL